jgi:NTE family protein
MWRKRLEQAERPRIGLALSGGAARGIAHVGVLKVLAEHKVPIDFVAGTSAGSIAGGALAAGMSIEEIEKLSRSLRWKDMGRMTLSRLGVQSNARMEDFLRKFLPVTRFEDLPTPFAAVATDLHSGDPVVMSGEGDIPFAIRASCTIPGWYIPVVDDHGRQLVDGGLVANVPAAAARSLGADLVIAVDVNAEGAKFLGPPHSAIGVIFQSMMVVQRTVSALQLQDADIVIRPRVGHIRWDEMKRADELIRLGEEAARVTIARILHLLEASPEPPPKWYQLRRRGQSEKTEDRRKLSPLR